MEIRRTELSKNKNNQILYNPSPYLDESLGGYLLRLTEANFFEKVYWIYDLAGLISFRVPLNPYLINSETEDLSKLSQLTRVEKGTLWSLLVPFLYEQKYNNEQYNFRIRDKYFIHAKKTKICPVCLKEKIYVRKFWDYSFFTCCPYHRCLLIDVCPNCNKYIKYNRKTVSRCNCGYNFLEAEVEKIIEGEDELSKLICLLIGIQVGNNIKETTINPLFGLKLDTLFEVLYFIIRNTHVNLIKLPNSKIKNKELHDILNQGFKVFTDWPNNYYLYLDKVHKLNKAKYSLQGVGQFGEFYITLYRKYMEGPLSFLWVEFENYIKFHWKGRYVGNNSNIKFHPEEKMFISSGEAEEHLGVDCNSIKKLVRSGVLDGEIRKSEKRQYVLLRKSSVECYNEILKRSLSTDEAASYLGISRFGLMDLFESSYLKIVRGPELDGNHVRLFDIQELDHFLEKLDAICKVSGDKYNEDEIIDFHKAHKAVSSFLQPNFITLVKFFDIVFSGQLTILKWNKGVGVQRYVFIKKEIKDTFEQKNEHYTPIEATRRLNIHANQSYLWIKKGFIKTKIENGKVIIQDEDLKLFSEKYITQKEIFKLFKRWPHRILKEILEYGIEPVSGPTIDGEEKYLFFRKDINNYFLKFYHNP